MKTAIKGDYVIQAKLQGETKNISFNNVENARRYAKQLTKADKITLYARYTILKAIEL